MIKQKTAATPIYHIYLEFSMDAIGGWPRFTTFMLSFGLIHPHVTKGCARLFNSLNVCCTNDVAVDALAMHT